MIKLTTNVARLNYIMDISSIISTEVLFETKPKMLEVRAFSLDKSRMLKVDIKVTAFDSYKTSGFKFFIDTIKIKRFLTILKPDEIVTLEYLEEESKIKISTNKNYRKISLITMMDCDVPDKMPEPPYDFVADVNADEFSSTIKLVKLEGDDVVVKNEGKLLHLFCINEDIGGKIEDINIKELEGAVYSIYSISFFMDILKFFPDYVDIKLHSKTDEKLYFPMIMSFTLLDNIGSLEYMIAPKVKVD